MFFRPCYDWNGDKGGRDNTQKNLYFFNGVFQYTHIFYTLYTYIFFYILYEKLYPLIPILDIAGAEGFFCPYPLNVPFIPYSPLWISIENNKSAKSEIRLKQVSTGTVTKMNLAISIFMKKAQKSTYSNTICP